MSELLTRQYTTRLSDPEGNKIRREEFGDVLDWTCAISCIENTLDLAGTPHLLPVYIEKLRALEPLQSLTIQGDDYVETITRVVLPKV